MFPRNILNNNPLIFFHYFFLKKIIKLNRQSTQDIQDGEMLYNTVQYLLYNAILMEICHYTFVQTTRMYNTKNEL